MFRATLAVLALLLTPAAATAAPTLQFLGEEILPTGLQFEGTDVGGLSSIAYDAPRDRYYVISDDQSVLGPARYYTFDLDVADGTLDPGDVVITDVTTLLDGTGLPFPAASFDPEGLASRSHSEYDASSDLLEMVKEDLVAERIAIQSYNEIIKWLGDDDPTTRRMMEEILAVEEEHADDLLNLLKKMR